jgi:ribosomal protein L37AE/L43A
LIAVDFTGRIFLSATFGGAGTTTKRLPDVAAEQDEIHLCPQCGQPTRHRAVRERVLAPVLWCLRCFHTRIEPAAAGLAGGDESAARS